MTEPKKKPRRTAERILEVSLDLFNRFGEPNVSTTLISAELEISPGNLYYHYPAKDELINALFDRYEKALGELLQAADGVGRLSQDGARFLRDRLAIELEAGSARRPLCRICLDWSERRPHLGGRLGAALRDRSIALGWIALLPHTRAVAITEAGRAGLAHALEIAVP